MNIKDIIITNNDTMMNGELTLSIEQWEEQINRIRYESYYEKYKNDKEMENVDIPYFNLPFYMHILMYEEIPTIEEFENNYFKIYRKEIQKDGEQIVCHGHNYPVGSFQGRFLRTYPSLIRDFHFYTMLKQSDYFDEVRWSYDKDTFEGKDIIVKYEGEEFDISLFAETKNGKFFKNVKNDHRHSYDKRSMELPLKMGKAQRCGEIYLYGESDVIEVFKFVLNYFDRELCPQCRSGYLIERISQAENNKGHKFWGCSKYPKCKYTRNIN